jgi:ABC-type ATPase with predicted acetyltransferase domain
VQYDFKCEKCGHLMRAAIRPRLCDRCGAGRRHIHKVESNPPAAK